MLEKWLRNSGVILIVLIGRNSISQTQVDTLKSFVNEEVLSDLKTFSSQQLLDSNSGFLGLNELLENSSPVYLKNYGNGQLATLSIRGNGASQTQLFWNGFKMNSPTLGQTDLSLIPTFFISDASLNYSGASSVNGSGGIGGSLDLSNKLSWKKGFHGIAGLEYGSFNNSNSFFGISYGGKKFFNEFKILHKKGENNFKYVDISKQNHPLSTQINNKLSQFGSQYSVGYQLNNKNLIQSTVLYFNSYRELPPIIGAVSNKENQQDEYVRSFISWKSFQKNFNSDLRVSYFNEGLNYTDSISSIFSETKVNTFLGQYRFNFKLLKKIEIESSIQSSHSLVQSNGYEGDKKRTESGLYLKASQEFKKLYCEVFARQELIDNNFSPIVYGLGFKYDPLKDWLIFKGNFSSNYRVPTLNDLYWAQGGNQYLNPEKGWSSEMGIVLNSGMKTKAMEGYGFMSESSYSITTFINQTQNWIQWIPTEFGYWSPKNVKQIENKGVEAKVEWNRSSKRTKIQAKLFYTYTHSRNKEFLIQNDERANRIPIYIPTHKANTYLSYSRRRLTFFYSQIYNGRVYIDESNSSYLPHYFPANTGISYFNVFKNLNYKIAGRINNLYNEPYQVVANRPIPGRNYSLNVTLKF